MVYLVLQRIVVIRSKRCSGWRLRSCRYIMEEVDHQCHYFHSGLISWETGEAKGIYHGAVVRTARHSRNSGPGEDRQDMEEDHYYNLAGVGCLGERQSPSPTNHLVFEELLVDS